MKKKVISICLIGMLLCISTEGVFASTNTLKAEEVETEKLVQENNLNSNDKEKLEENSSLFLECGFTYDEIESINIKDDNVIYTIKSEEYESDENPKGIIGEAEVEKLENGDINVVSTEDNVTTTTTITKDDKILINGREVIYEEEVEVISQENYMKNIASGPQYAAGWSKWTTSPMIGTAGQYTKVINVKKTTVKLEQEIHKLGYAPLKIALEHKFKPVKFIGDVVSIVKSAYTIKYSSKNIYMTEVISEHKSTYKAKKYTYNFWKKSTYTGYLKSDIYYLTIG